MKWWKAISFPFRLSVVFGWWVKKEKRILCFDKTSPHNHCNVGYWLSKIWVALKRAGVLSSLSCSLHVFFIWRRCLFGFWFLVSCSDLSSYFPHFSSISLEGDKSSSGTSNFLQKCSLWDDDYLQYYEARYTCPSKVFSPFVSYFCPITSTVL